MAKLQLLAILWPPRKELAVIEQHTGPSRFEAPPVGELSTESVRVQLGRITACRTFANAPVLHRFLEHIVEYVLQGRTDQLKEYALGVALKVAVIPS